MITIENLREIAKINLGETCFKKYKALIEPSIEELLSNPMGDWKEVESHITQMVMKTEGFFKGSTIIISLDKGSNEAFGEKVDAKKFQEIKMKKFKEKINDLHKKDILGDSSYRLLDKAREVRNKLIPDEFARFPEKDRTLFHIANVVTFNIWLATMSDFEKGKSNNLKSDVEKFAEQWLLKINSE